MNTQQYKKQHAEHYSPKVDWTTSNKLMQLQEAIERELIKIENKYANETKWMCK